MCGLLPDVPLSRQPDSSPGFSCCVTDSTGPTPVGSNVSVLDRKGVTARTVRLTRPDGRRMRPVSHVVPVGYGLQMIRPNTEVHLTQVIDLAAFWDWSHKVLVTPPVRVDVSSGPAPSRKELSIGAFGPTTDHAGPDPTSGGLLYVPPKPDLGVDWFRSFGRHLCMVPCGITFWNHVREMTRGSRGPAR